MSGNQTAHIEVLTAEVRTLMVGSRQVTLSVYRQLDWVPPEWCKPFGRVQDNNRKGSSKEMQIVGAHQATGSLVRSSCKFPRASQEVTAPPLIDWWEYADQWNGNKTYRWDRLVAALILEENSDYVFWHLFTFAEYHTKSDYYWRFINPEKEAKALQLAQIELDDLRKSRKFYLEWSSLPLIVLAGLR